MRWFGFIALWIWLACLLFGGLAVCIGLVLRLLLVVCWLVAYVGFVDLVFLLVWLFGCCRFGVVWAYTFCCRFW